MVTASDKRPRVGGWGEAGLKLFHTEKQVPTLPWKEKSRLRFSQWKASTANSSLFILKPGKKRGKKKKKKKKKARRSVNFIAVPNTSFDGKLLHGLR